MTARLLSAAVGTPILVGAIWLGAPWLTALVGAVAVLGYWELRKLTATAEAAPPLYHGAFFTLALALNGHWEATYTLPIIAAGLLTSLLWQAIRSSPTKSPLAWAMGLAGPLYIGVPLSFALLLRGEQNGREWLLLVLLVTFATDSAAYIIGRLLGRHRMAPSISPKKTWEGAAGGLIGAGGASVALEALLGLPLVWWEGVAVGLVLGVVAQFGDLAESWLKRAFNAEEAGHLVPGHGGVLDRLDSVVFTLVVMYYGVVWVVQ